MTDVSVYFHTLGSDGHGTETCLKLSDDVIAEEKYISIERHVDAFRRTPLHCPIQFHCRLVFQRRIAYVIILIERVVQIVAVGLGHRGRTTAPAGTKGKLRVVS